MARYFYIFSLLQIVIFILSLVTDWYVPLVIIINLIILMMLMDKLGKGIVLREIIAFHSTFICLLMPLAGYLIYNRSNALAILWVRYMPIKMEVYFNYALPAVTAFIVVLCWPIYNGKFGDIGQPCERLLQQAKIVARDKTKLGIGLLAIGVLMPSIIDLFPVSLQYIFNLFYFSAYAGLLYVYFSEPFPYKKIILTLFSMFIVFISLKEGMFTIIAYMGMTLFSFLFLGRKSSFIKKFSYFILGALILVIIQSVKPDYRKILWKTNYQGNKAILFTELVTKKMSNTPTLLSADAFFPIYYRTNQGINLSLVMKRFPVVKPFDNGSNLLVIIASSLVPRLFWPDKPEAGGIANMKYYTGLTIKGWSTNVGPLGEAYASFGIYGGIIYMMLLGYFIRFAYRSIFVIAKKMPIILYWIPVLFYQVTYSAENDTLQILNSLFKSGLFIFLLYKLLPVLFIKVKQVTLGSNVQPA